LVGFGGVLSARLHEAWRFLDRYIDFHPASLMTPNDEHKTYPAFGRCIYCSPTAKIPNHLGDEHIIPLSFGGGRLLPRASCRDHETITTRFEDHCFKGMLETARYHLGLKRRQKLKRSKLRVLLADGSKSEPIPIENHPSALIMPVMPPPNAYIRVRETEDLPPALAVSLTPMGQDIMERAKRLGVDINLTRGLSALEFYRLIAKIAHSFAMAELGPTFSPYLINLIETNPPMFASHLIGSGLGDPPPPSDRLHEIEFAPSLDGPVGDELIQVRIRLFANLGFANHYAIVGSRSRDKQGSVSSPTIAAR
jgi:hypothetical protein